MAGERSAEGFGGAGTVAVVAAMVQELGPLRRRLGLRPVAGDVAHLYEGTSGGRRIVGVVTSMGTAAATDVTSAVLDRYDVDHLLAIGIAGAVAEDLAIGELLAPAAVEVEHTGERLDHAPLGGVAPRGTLLSTDRLHNTPEALAELRARDVVAVDMETAAIALVADARGVPWSVLRAISDRAGDPLVDDELLAMTRADGSADIGATARYLIRHPGRIPHLARLGRGMRAAVGTITDATVGVLSS